MYKNTLVHACSSSITRKHAKQTTKLIIILNLRDWLQKKKPSGKNDEEELSVFKRIREGCKRRFCCKLYAYCYLWAKKKWSLVLSTTTISLFRFLFSCFFFCIITLYYIIFSPIFFFDKQKKIIILFSCTNMLVYVPRTSNIMIIIIFLFFIFVCCALSFFQILFLWSIWSYKHINSCAII